MIPANTKAMIADLKSAYEAAVPLESAPPLVFAELVKKADETIAAIDADIVAYNAKVGGFDDISFPPDFATTLKKIVAAGQDSLDLHEARSLVGRFTGNIKATRR